MSSNVHNLISIGWLSIKSCYLDVPVEEAKRRYVELYPEDAEYIDKEGFVNVFPIKDQFFAYEISQDTIDQREVEKILEQNYNSHNWQLVRDPGSPYQSPEHMVVCKDCGIEDMGHPDEFDIEYPNCANGGKD